MTEPTRTKLPMICSCGEERRALVQVKRDEVAAHLGVTDHPEMFVSAVVMSFNHDFRDVIVDVHSIHADMWFGISVDILPYARANTHFERVRIECDLVEDGLAALWLYVKDNYEMEDDGA